MGWFVLIPILGDLYPKNYSVQTYTTQTYLVRYRVSTKCKRVWSISLLQRSRGLNGFQSFLCDGPKSGSRIFWFRSRQSKVMVRRRERTEDPLLWKYKEFRRNNSNEKSFITTINFIRVSTFSKTFRSKSEIFFVHYRNY